MDCVELQESLIEIEDASSAEQRAHLKTCSACTSLVQDLKLIASAAPALQGSLDPSPRVWNSLEIALRQEGLIRAPKTERRVLSSFGLRWGRAGWLVPVAAALLVAVGLYVRDQSPAPGPVAQAPIQSVVQKPVAEAWAAFNDDDFQQEVANSAPVMKAQWEDSLRDANDYIRDAQSEVDENPNDVEARQSLMDAYQQKAMLFEMAMDRSLP